jgi:hypothetical protein
VGRRVIDEGDGVRAGIGKRTEEHAALIQRWRAAYGDDLVPGAQRPQGSQ